MSYRAWWIYWLALAVWALVALGVAVTRVRLGPAEPQWVFGLSAPLLIAGLDLILYRTSHERICAIEAREHAWLRVLVAKGYSARTFLITGVALAAAGVLLGAGLLLRR